MKKTILALGFLCNFIAFSQTDQELIDVVQGEYKKAKKLQDFQANEKAIFCTMVALNTALKGNP